MLLNKVFKYLQNAGFESTKEELNVVLNAEFPLHEYVQLYNSRNPKPVPIDVGDIKKALVLERLKVVIAEKLILYGLI